MTAWRRIRTQKTGTDCGPVAIQNAYVMLGLKPPSLRKLRRMLRTDRAGTGEQAMMEALSDLPLKLIDDRDITTLYPGHRTMILGYMAGNMGHYCVISRSPANIWLPFDVWTAHNAGTDHAVEHRPIRELKRHHQVTEEWLRRKMKSKHAEVYILEADRE